MRFNVPFPGYEHLDNNNPEWLQYRLELAELTSFHSLKQQSLSSFKLVILIDPNTPESFIDALTRATRGLGTIFFKADSASPDTMTSTLLDHVDADCMAIQTSRIDSDDMFHPDYLLNISDYCTQNGLFAELEHSPRYFRYPHGQDYVTHSATCNRVLYPENAFGTLIEPVSNALKTVFCDNHKRMSKRFVSFSLDDEKAMWCRILHGSNLLNKPRKPLPLKGHFPVHPGLSEFAKRTPVHAPPRQGPASHLAGKTDPSLP
ncbi:MAG TPA: glycosyltransferase [Tabrizicola sp.]|nr:glycosyltransferase [Tabrizicola sp.]